MVQSSYKFCPRCANPLKIEHHEGMDRQICSVCGFVFFQNQNVTVSAIIIRDRKILLVRRSRDPHQGMLDIPGGFVHPIESPEEGVLREVAEELGVEGRIIKLLGVYGPDPYEYEGQTVYNSSAHYQVDIASQEPKPADDAESIEWHAWKMLDVDRELPFNSHRIFIKKLQAGELHLD